MTVSVHAGGTLKKGLRTNSQKYLTVRNSEEQNNIVFRAQR